MHSCKDSEVRDPTLTIDLSEKGIERKTKVSGFTSKMKVIKLENSQEALLADIVSIEIYDSLIYIMDNIFNGIFLFDLNGDLRTKFVKEGNGPGEYLSIDDFLIDEHIQTLEILDRVNSKIHIYNLKNFNYIETIDLPVTFCFKFLKNGDNYYLQTNGARNNINNTVTNSEVIAYDHKTKKTRALFNTLKTENQTWEFTDIFYLNENDLAFCSFAWDKYVYEISKDSINPYLRVDAQSRSYPDDVLNGSYDKKMTFLNSNEVKGKVNFFKLLMKRESSFLLAYGIGYPPQICYYISHENAIVQTNNLTNDFLPVKQENLEIFKEENGHLLSVIYPYKLEEGNEIIEYLEMEKEDNPVLLMFKLTK